MKWRERISILSRKRKTTRNASGEESRLETPSASSSGYNDDRDSVKNTLSQIRPVIGPDHKSYYILLRGNEDSFTCIQPAKEVVTSLDEIFRNVANTVKDCKSHGMGLPPYLQTTQVSEGRSQKNASRKTLGGDLKVNGVSKSVRSETRFGNGMKLDSVFDIKPEEKFLGTENVVENVVLNRTIQTVNSNHNEVRRTSTLVYPLVQNRLDSSTVASGTEKTRLGKKHGHHKKTVDRGIPQEPVVSLPSTYSSAQSHNNFTNFEEEPELQKIKEPELQKNISLNNGTNECNETQTSDGGGLLGKEKPITEVRLLAKDGCVLTEEAILTQVKALVESETIVVGENSHVVASRESAQEVILRILPKEMDLVQVIEDTQTVKDDVVNIENSYMPYTSEECKEEDTTMTLTSPILPFFDPDVLVNSNGKCDVENKVEYLLTSVPSTPSEIFEDCGMVKESNLVKDIQPEDVDSGYSMIEPSLGGNDSLEIEKFLTGHPLLDQNEEIVIFQRADGALVNQDGTPISTNLQYLITSSQLDDQTAFPDSMANNIFLTTGP
ncbi:hypothetical protein SK128_003504 [Halocaridina rubra]|uniref:Uncharacterized protein n=1 Tax=Halocaridina rubra TaxID=373956 RepID=A0AAN8WYC9_HALRR